MINSNKIYVNRLDIVVFNKKTSLLNKSIDLNQIAPERLIIKACDYLIMRELKYKIQSNEYCSNLFAIFPEVPETSFLLACCIVISDRTIR